MLSLLITLAACVGASAGLESAPQETPVLTLSTTHSRGVAFPVLLREEGLVLTVDEGEVKVWDLDSGHSLRTYHYPAGYNGVSRPVHIPDRGWFAVPCSNGLHVYRTSDLGLEFHVPETGLSLSHYDVASKRLVSTARAKDGLRVVTIDLDTRTATGRTFLPGPPQGTPMLPYVFELLPSGKYLVQLDLNLGSALIDPDAWTTVDRRPSENRRILPVGNGDLVAVSLGSARVELLDGQTFAVKRAADHALDVMRDGPVVYQGLTIPREGERAQLLFLQGRNVLQLDPETLAETNRIDLQAAFAPRTMAPAGIRPLSSERWLAAVWGRTCTIDWRVPALGSAAATNTFLGGYLDPLPSGVGFHVSNWTAGCVRVECRSDDVSVAEQRNAVLRPQYSEDGTWVAFARQGETALHVAKAGEFPHQSRAFDRTGSVAPDKFPSYLFSRDNSRVVSQGYLSTHVYDVATGALVFELAHATAATTPYWLEGFSALTADGGNIALARVTGDPLKATQRFVEAYDMVTRQPLWKAPGALAPLAYSDDGATLLAVDLEQRALVRLDAKTGETREHTPIPAFAGAEWKRWALSPDGRHVLVSEGTRVAAFEVATGKQVSEHAVAAKSMQDLEFFASGEHFMTLNDDNLVRMWRVGVPGPLATFTLLGNLEWCLHTPDFLFQASVGAREAMYFVKGRTRVPLESLFEQFYTPGLGLRLFAGEALAPPVEVAKIAVPPTVRVSLEPATRGLVVEDDLTVVASAVAEVRVAVEAASATEAIAEVRLFHNGKLVQSKTRGLVVEDDDEAHRERQSFPVTLLPGENTLKAVALNAQRTESRPAELVIDYRVPPPIEGGAAPPQDDSRADTRAGLALHLVVVGVNQYRNPRFNLNYAVADATAVRDRVRELAGKMFSRVEVHTLFDADAVKPKIVAKLEEIAGMATQRDVFVFYYAGHGVMSGETPPRFYLVPHDITQMYGADERLAASALSSVELQELSRRIPAQKQLFVLDACQSAGALDSVAVRGAAEQKAIAQLARSSGTHWLTASGSEQFATEFEALGHGAFTYALLEGLAGRADSGDGRVTVRELSAFLESEVPEVTQKHKGTMQFPASYSFGQDFPIVISGG